jgi:hypothetical protein
LSDRIRAVAWIIALNILWPRREGVTMADDKSEPRGVLSHESSTISPSTKAP